MYEINYDTSIHILKTPIPTLCGVKWGGVGWGGLHLCGCTVFLFLAETQNIYRYALK